MGNWTEHIWCDCLACDDGIEAFQILIVRTEGPYDELELTFAHFPLLGDTSYVVFGELYHILNRRGDILDPQYIDWDEDEDEEDDC